MGILDHKKNVDEISENIRQLQYYNEKDLVKHLKNTLNLVLKAYSDFVAEMTRVIDECRVIVSYIEREKRALSNPFYGELPIPIKDMIPSITKGIYQALCEDLSKYAENVRNEYDILRNQYGTSYSHLRDNTSLFLASTNVKLASVNKNLQLIMVVLTFVLLLLTIVEVVKLLQ
ncbi:hypothetical protein Ferp_0417 [Ferroglobus placidus DSM 10642]|uniref:Uncharacterized protein n=1 Tax=Ferroglobus placidus (strain DSM 10642 / AEDII12DO) TaxID=589924 RepID=D3S2W1_FERPA|nr:hypothetical protein [Ferroglobus placidus]ADC64594.1 hypothetical protein Ferp_0417 [Ferroglobus placidus DSM 10642]